MVQHSPQFADGEHPPVFPVCLVVDVSGSMYGPPIDAVNRVLPKLQRALLGDPTGDVARLTLIAFESIAHIALPLSDLHHTRLPFLQAGGATNFHDAFTQARLALETGIRALDKGTRIYRPVVFFLSDGGNTDADWRPAWEQLVSPASEYSAEVVSFGMGAADRKTISAVSTRYAFSAGDADPATAVRAILATVIGSIKTTANSFTTESPALTVPTATGLTPLPVSIVG